MLALGMEKKKRASKQLTSVVAVACIFLSTFLLSLVSGSFFFSVRNSSAETASVDILANIDTVLSVTTNAVAGEVAMTIVPSDTGTLGTKDFDVIVSTNNAMGYVLTMSSDTENTDLVNTATASATIPSTTRAHASPSVLTVNTWGHSVWAVGQVVPSTTFSLIPPLSAPRTIKNTNVPANGNRTTLTIGANVDTAQLAGTYANSLVFTATAN